MRFIGITGGVGAGKSAILAHLASKPGIRVMLADEIAHDLMQPGTECFQKLKELNAIVHPAVREYVLQQKEAEERAGKLFLLVLEAALLIEEHYDEICDELWYIYTTEENRRARLKASRGYSDAHVDRIFASQLSEEEYRRHCRVVIDNNGTLEETLTQTEEALRREAYE